MSLADALASEDALNRRHRVVLWALAVARPRSVSCDQLAEALWSGPQPATRDKVIQGSISTLRKTYGPTAISTVDGAYRLAWTVLTACDQFQREVVRSEQFLEVGQADRAAYLLEATLGCWPGPPYADLAGWPPAVAEQARLTELTLRAEESHVWSLLAAGRAESALPVARHRLTAEPLREVRWLALARAEYSVGNQADALEVLRNCRSTFREELGIDPSDTLAELELAMLRQDPILHWVARAVAPDACPWPGLSSYEQGDADGFFGRDEDCSVGLRILHATGALAVAGPSGIGKSSFVRAGLTEALMRSGRSVHVTTPRLGLPTQSYDVLVLDQAEEVFTLSAQEATALLEGLDGQSVVLSIRTDGLVDAARVPRLARLIEASLFLIGGIGAAGLREVIEQPAFQNGLVIEPGLVDVILRDLEGEPAALPMFSHALSETWRRREGRTLTIDGYSAAGGVRGAIAQTAESLYASLDEPHRHELHSLMLRLVSTDEDGQTSRVRLARSRVVVSKDLVERLIATRLVTSDQDMLAITHEALVTAWPRFREWLADDVEGRRQWQHLSQAAVAWSELGRADAELYRGVRLERAAQWVGATTLEISGSEREFLAASQAAAAAERERAQRETERQSRSNRRLRALSWGLSAVTAVAVTTGAIAGTQRERAEAERRAAASAALEADASRVGALALNTDDPQAALLLAVAAERLDPGVATDRSLFSTLAERPELIASATDPAIASGNTELASAGPRIFTEDASHTVFVFTPGLRPAGKVDLGDGHVDNTPGHLAAATNVVAASASSGGSPIIQLLDPLSLRPVPIALQGLPRGGLVESLDLSANGRFLAATLAVLGRHEIVSWRLDTGTMLGPPITVNPGSAVRIADDGGTVFSTAPVAEYAVVSGTQRWHRWTAPAATLDARGGLVAVPAEDGSALELLDTSTGRTVEELTGAQGAVGDIAFSPDGAVIAATASDGTTTVWDVASATITHRLQTGGSHGLAYSAYGDTLYTDAATPGSLLAWDLVGQRSFLTRIPREGFQGAAEGVARVSPDGNWIAVSGAAPDHPELRLGTLQPGPLRVVVPSGSWSGVGAWSPDGDRYVYADRSGALTLLNSVDGARLRTRLVSTARIVDVAFVEPGVLAVLDDAGVVRFLEAATLEERSQVSVPGKAFGITGGGGFALVTSAASAGGANWSAPVSTWTLFALGHNSPTATGSVGVRSASVAAYSPDGRRVAFGGQDGEVAILSMPSGRVIGREQPDAGASVNALAWSSDSSRVVASTGSALQLWDAERGIELAQVKLPVGELSASAGFSSDGTISVLTLNGDVYRWNPSAQAAADFACRVAGRDLTAQEWRDAFAERTYQRSCSSA